MFVTNRSPYRVVLAKTALTDTEGCAAIVVESHYRIGSHGLLPLPAHEREPRPTDPPDIMRHPVWVGVSITAVGRVEAPGAATSQRVVLTVGTEVRTLITSAPRRWTRRGRDLVPTVSGPFTPLELSYAESFGGAYDLLPGLLPGTDLPHPGGRIAYVLNPGGVGFHADERAAEGKPLPRIEYADELVRRWDDRPTPAGFAPCPELAGLRLIHLAARAPKAHGDDPDVREALRMLHYAPDPLIFPDLGPGTVVVLSGTTAGPLRLRLLASPVEVVVAATDLAVPGRLRAAHIDATAGTLSMVHHHALMTRAGYPRRLVVNEVAPIGA